MSRVKLHPLPDAAQLQSMLPVKLVGIIEAINHAGGRGLLVGGYVRDLLRGRPSKDLDVEVCGLDLPALEGILAAYGEVQHVGRAFGVLRVRALDVDFSLPRQDSRTGLGHRGIEATVDPSLDYATSSSRRDLTINSMALDPLSAELLDPHGGYEDLEAGRLRATDPASFGEDPLRGLRVAQLAARLDMEPDQELLELSGDLDLSELSPERIYDEFVKLLMKGARPSIGLRFLQRSGLLRFFTPLAAMVGVPQDPKWHPEGDVWVHTLMVVDEASKLRDLSLPVGAGAVGEEKTESGRAGPTLSVRDKGLALMFGALCHDLGKPATTFADEQGRIRSPQHDVRGVTFAARLLHDMRAPRALIERVQILTRHHLAPASFHKGRAKAGAYRRLARRLESVGLNLEHLELLARADHFGRTTPEALARRFPAGDAFLQQARELALDRGAPADVVRARHLLARGLEPGPALGRLLRRCREIQDESGWTDPDRIVDRVLDERDGLDSLDP